MKINLLLIYFLFLSLFLNAQSTVFYLESFETEGSGLRYTLSHNFDAGNSYFKRGQLSNFGGMSIRSKISNLHGEYFVGVEDANGAPGSPGNAVVFINSEVIDISDYDDLLIDISIAADDRSVYEPFRFSNGDYVTLEYRIDGGVWTRALYFRNQNKSASTPL